ncbi:MAG: hypothetical protein II086_00370 [Ruminococcus sp.]|nr:hypothetical protein [Ruminococcus sp.]
MNGKGNPGFVPLTARELKNMHGLSVEEGLRQGYCIEGHVKEYQKLHAAMLAQERKALAAPGYNIRAPYQRKQSKKKAASEAGTSLAEQKKISQVYDITITEECQMENTENIRTRLALVLCLMESPLFAETDSNLKLEMLSQLLYDQPLTAEADAPKADKPKHPGGRPKKAAEKKDGETE